MIARFSGADAPGWTAPDSGELREHFDDRFLAVIPARTLVEQASKMAADLRAELVVLSAGPLEAVVQLTSRTINVESIDDRLLRSWTNPTTHLQRG